MTAYDMARAVYESEPCARSFEEDIALHFRYGYVFSQQDAFLMGRPVDKNASYEAITSPWVSFGSPNAWLVWLAAGAKAFEIFLSHEPFQMPYIGWERDNRLRWYPRETLIRHVTRSNPRRYPILQRWRGPEAAPATEAAFTYRCGG